MPLDIIIVVTEQPSGYQARVRIEADILALAQMSLAENKSLAAKITRARKYICMKARWNMMKSGRPNRFLAWEDISITIVGTVE